MTKQRINLRDSGTRRNYIKSLLDAARDRAADLQRVIYKPKDYTQQVRAEIAVIRKGMTVEQNDETPDKKLFAQAHQRVRERLQAASARAHQQAVEARTRAEQLIADALNLAQTPTVASIELPADPGYGNSGLVPYFRKLIQQNALAEARAMAALMTPQERLTRLAEADPETDAELITVLDAHVHAHVTHVTSRARHAELAAHKLQALGRALTMDEVMQIDREWKQEQALFQTGYTAVRERRLTDEDRRLRDEWATLMPSLKRDLDHAGGLLKTATEVGALPEDPRAQPSNVVEMRPIEAA